MNRFIQIGHCPIPGFSSPAQPTTQVWSGELSIHGDDLAVLEYVFEIFNCDPPANYQARSLSVGDEVTITDRESPNRIYLCTNHGWQRINDTSAAACQMEVALDYTFSNTRYLSA
jgi:hypothetical protein